MENEDVLKIIEDMRPEEAKECLKLIANTVPEAYSVIEQFDKEKASGEKLENISDSIDYIISKYTIKRSIPEDLFGDLCIELDRYNKLGKRYIEKGNVKEALQIFYEIVSRADDIINSTTDECFDLDLILEEIKAAERYAENHGLIDKSCTEIKALLDNEFKKLELSYI